MRALRSCDFCDAEAVGTFEVVPPELEPTDAEQRRVVLCTDCSNRLETLLEPLLDRLGADGTDRAETETAAVTADAAAAANPEERRSIEGITVEHDATGETDREPDSETSETSASESGADAIRPETDDETPSATAAELDHEETSPDTSDEPDGTAPDSAAGESDGIGVETPGEDAAETGADRDGDSGAMATAATRNQAPKAYAKVVRLLRNREFPMERDAVESLAAGAYDLENHEVEAILDRAIENGEFAEDGRLLRRA